MNIDKLERANIIAKSLIPKVDELLNMSSKSRNDRLADANFGFLGCATKKIAQHFGKYFGMLITEAKYGDMVDFEIIENKYQ